VARLLGVDIGTTSFKVAVFDESGTMLTCPSVHAPDETIHLDGARVDIWRAEALWEALRGLVRRALECVSPRDIDAVAIVGMGMVGVPLDARGRPLGPLVTWIDPGHTQSVVSDLGGDNDSLFEVTGNRCSAIYPPAWIAWMSAHCPGYASGMHKWVDVASYLTYRLCDELAVDYSMASQFVSLDQRRLACSTEVMESLGLSPDVFATPQQAGSHIGAVSARAAADTGLLPGTPVILGAADYVTGILGGGFTEPGDIAILTGTWELVVACLARPALDAALQKIGAICDAHVAPDRWALRMENYSGAVSEWYRTQLGLLHGGGDDCERFWQRLVSDAESAERGSGGVVFVPHLFGSLGPRYDELARGAFVGIRPSTRRQDIARALFEGLCLQSLDAYRALVDTARLDPQRVVFMGGGAKNDLWVRTRTDMLGREIDVVTTPDVTPRGAAMVAGVGAGVFSSFDEAVTAMRPSSVTVVPDPESTDYYAELYERVYRPLQEHLAPANHALSSLERTAGVTGPESHQRDLTATLECEHEW
jgi:xylulokinase